MQARAACPLLWSARAHTAWCGGARRGPMCTHARRAHTPVQVERVLGVRQWADGKLRHLVKWRGLPYCEATYETVGWEHASVCVCALQGRSAAVCPPARPLRTHARTHAPARNARRPRIWPGSTPPT